MRRKVYIIVAIAIGCLVLIVIGLYSKTRNTYPQSEDFVLARSNSWVGITPGLTTFAEARRLLVAHYSENQVTVENDSISWKSESSGIVPQGGWLIANQQGIVDDIELSSFPKELITVERLISQIGVPSDVYVNVFHCGGSLLFYSGVGIIADLYPESATSIGVHATQSVASLELLPVHRGMPWTDELKLPWQGYKNYTEDCERIMGITK